MRLICLLTFLLLPVTSLAEDRLDIAAGQTGYEAFPGEYEKIEQALTLAGIEFSITFLPDERALDSAGRGQYAMLPLRQTVAVEQYSSLIQLLPPVASSKVYIVVNKENAEICNRQLDDLKDYSVAGVIGTRIFEAYIYPLFKKRFALNDHVMAMKMVAAQRADSTVWVGTGFDIEGLSEREKDSLRLCEDLYLEFSFYSFLHEDYLHLKDRIEAAYQEVFTQP